MGPKRSKPRPPTSPEDAGEILLEAAAAWRRAGRDERAIEVLLSLITTGDDDGCYARLELVEVYFDQGADAEAYSRRRQRFVDGVRCESSSVCRWTRPTKPCR